MSAISLKLPDDLLEASDHCAVALDAFARGVRPSCRETHEPGAPPTELCYRGPVDPEVVGQGAKHRSAVRPTYPNLDAAGAAAAA